jgi:hypothetical protein
LLVGAFAQGHALNTGMIVWFVRNYEAANLQRSI